MGKLLVVLLALVVIAVIAGLLYRPATVIGVSEKSLASSIRGSAGADKTGPCNQRDGDRFVCAVFDPATSGSASYRVDVGDYGCWDATVVRGSDKTRPGTLSGCITIIDLARGEG